MNEELPPSRSREGGPTDSSVVGDSCGVGRPALVRMRERDRQMSAPYLSLEETPTREQIEAMPGLVLLEFGTDWCGICRALQPRVAEQMAVHPEIRHLKVEDGPGRPLGRSFRVKLWPSLVFLKDGAVVRQLVRPSHAELKQAFEELGAPSAAPKS
jgi:thioredoxin 1